MLTGEYHAPDTIAEACALLTACPDGRILAGGTDLLVQIRSGRIAPGTTIDIKRLRLDQIREDADGVLIGAATRHADLAEHPVIRSRFPPLAAACRSIGGAATRHRGTIGGNVVNASPVADTVPALLAYDAIAQLAGPDGPRSIPLNGFFLGYRQTALAPHEMLVGLLIPYPARRSAGSFHKKAGRQALAIAGVNVALRVDLGVADRVDVARIALGSVGPTALLSAAAAALEGGRLDDGAIDTAARAAAAAVNPISDVRSPAWYRTRLVEVVIRRGLTDIRTRLAAAVPERHRHA